MSEEQQLKLQAFLDGELPENEAREILAWTQRDPAAAALLAELENVSHALARAELISTLPESRGFFWAKIEREIQRLEPEKIPAQEISIFKKLRKLLLPASGFAILIAAGVTAHFIFSAPKAVVETEAEADTASVETSLADADATTYRDESEGTTLVLFSDNAPEKGKKSTSAN
jgi:anti-sigma factor RsiW